MAKKRARANGYFGLGRIISLILAIIPPTNIFCGIVTRVVRGKLLLAVLNFFICPVFYVIDLVSIIVNNKLKWLV